MNDTAATPNTQEAQTYPTGMDQSPNAQTPPPTVVRIREPDKLSPLHVVMVFLATAVVAGGCLLLSAPESVTLVDGALAWGEESPLRAVVQLLCLNYGAPTLNAGDVKNYVMGIGTGLAILALVVGVLSRSRGEDDASQAVTGAGMPRRKRLSSLAVAQLLVALYLLWSFASSRWSRAPSMSVDATTLLSIQFLWSFALAASLNHAAARVVTRILVGAIALAAAIAVWYHTVRNPVLSAKFPFGNPTFLATALLAGLIPAVVYLGDSLRSVFRQTSQRKLIGVGASAVALGFSLWAFQLTESRGPAVGLLFGVLAIVFFSLHGWRKWLPILLGLGVSVAGWFYLAEQADAFSPTGRSATIRFRLTAWQHAWEMFKEKPITGHGQGGFVLTGDTLIGDEVLDDPLPFIARLTHAHNEWLETLCDLGGVGLVFISVALLLTFHAGVQQIRSGVSGRTSIALIGVMSALVAIIVSECFGVGLRVTGVPTIFFTLVGLTWALSMSPAVSVVETCSRTSRRRMTVGVVGGLIGIVGIAATQQDFSAARSAYDSGVLVAKGQTVKAAAAAAQGILRLNPVRALSNRARLVEVHVLIAESHIGRGVDRDRRAAASDPPDTRLAALALQDYQLADEHSRDASRQLKELVSRAPGFIGTGRLEFRINLVRAQNEVSRGDLDASKALLKNAAAALERDMARRPFEPVLVTDYLRVALDWLSIEEAIEVLARPLRHNRLADAYVTVLQHLSSQTGIDATIKTVEQNATAALGDVAGATADRWAPEKLRITGAIRFLRRDFAGATAVLRTASTAYDKLAASAPLGSSACYAELADAIFYGDILHPAAAIEIAKHAIELTPRSQQGRALRVATERRLIQYLLASGDEIAAVDLIRLHAPAGASETDVKAQHGHRIRLLLDAMRGQYHETLRTNDPKSEIVKAYRRFLSRGLKLNPAEPGLHYLAADLAVLDKNPAIAARALESALRRGFPLDDAARFLEAAARVLPDSDELRLLAGKVSAARGEAGGATDPARIEKSPPRPSPSSKPIETRPDDPSPKGATRVPSEKP